MDDPEYPLIGFTVMAFFVGYLLVSRLMRRVVRPNGMFDENRRARARRARASRSSDTREKPNNERKRARRASGEREAEERDGEAYDDARDQPYRHEARIKDVGHYARVLGLKGRVTPDVLRARYRELAAQYHPDKVHHLGPKLQALAARELKAINEAHAYFKKRMGL